MIYYGFVWPFTLLVFLGLLIQHVLLSFLVNRK